MKKLLCIIIPIFICVSSFFLANSFLDKNIKRFMNEKDIKSINYAYSNKYKDRGYTYFDNILSSDTLLIQGSSELTSPVPELPTKILPKVGMQDIAISGRAYISSLQHANILGAHSKISPDNKVVFLLSMPWYTYKDGVSKDNYEVNFAPVQFYHYLDNQKISLETKKEYAKRVSYLLSDSVEYYPEKIYADSYISDSLMVKAQNILIKPFIYVRRFVVDIKDKGVLYKKLKELPNKTNKFNKNKEIDNNFNWDYRYKLAEEEAKEKTGDNQFGMYDSYYNKYVKDYLDKRKNYQKNFNLLKSKEFDDYKVFLNTCRDMGVKPYIVIMPVNGLWYDYAGITKEKRYKFYDTVKQMALDYDFDVLDMREDEYTPYFITDTMHLGTKGWLKVDQEIYKHFNN